MMLYPHFTGLLLSFLIRQLVQAKERDPPHIHIMLQSLCQYNWNPLFDSSNYLRSDSILVKLGLCNPRVLEISLHRRQNSRAFWEKSSVLLSRIRLPSSPSALMSSFFAKLHGRTSTAATTTKARPLPHCPRHSPQAAKPTNTGDAQKGPEPSVPSLEKGNKKDKKSKSSVGNAAQLENGKNPRAKNSSPATPMRRTQSSSTILPITKKRKTTHTTTQNDHILREISRVASLAPSNDVKRRRTASPAYRIHRSPSDNETDFSEPVKLFRDETPDISHQPAVERSMLNPRAGGDPGFMHAKELVCEVDKDSFVPDDPVNPALEITVKLPFGEETYPPLNMEY